MKRILYSCLFLTFIFLSNNIFGQAFNFAITQSVQCYAPGTNSAQAFVTFTYAGPPAAASYTWAISSPTPISTCSSVPVPAIAGGTLCNFTFPCCGIYNITCYPVDAFGAIIPFGQVSNTVLVECPVTGTASSSASSSSGSICAGSTATLNALGGVTWTWTPGNLTGSSPTVSPLANTCYTANGTTAAGCTVQANTCLTVQTIALNVTPPSQTICVGTTVTLTANTTATPVSSPITYQWYENPPGGPPLGTTQTQTMAPGATSVYSVNVTVNTCSASATNTITIGPALSMTASASSVSVCQTESVVLTATSSATSYTWTSLTSAFTATGNPVTAVGPGVYVVNGENGICNAAPATVTVYLTNFTPTITAPAANFSICAGEQFTLSAIGGAANSYTWTTLDPVTGLPAAIVPPIGSGTVATSQFTTTAYGVGAISPGGCFGSASISIGMSPTVVVNVAASAASVCATKPVTLTASGATLYTFVSFDGTTTSTISPSSTTSVIVVNPTSNTTYTVYGTTASGYCQGQNTIAVNMITGGTLTLTTTSSAPSICPGQSSSLTAFGALSYTWAPGASLSNTSGSTTIASPTLTGVNVYTVTGDNNGGCFGVATVTVNVNAIPSLTIGWSAQSICAGFTSTLTASGAATYTWTGNTFAIPINQASISVSPGSYTVIGGSAGANCPSLPQVKDITLSPPLTIGTGISPIQGTTCIEQNYPYKLSKPVNLFATGASAYVWSPYNPAYMTYSLGAQTTVRPPTSTCYTVTGSTSICSGTAQICVVVTPQFTFGVTPPLPAICLGDSMKLYIGTITNSTLSLPPYTYEWRDPQGPSMTSQTTQTTQVFPQSTGTYTVEVKDARACISLPRLITVTVLPQPLTAIAIPTINNVPTNTICFVGDRPSAPDNVLDLYARNINTGLPPGVSHTYTWNSPYYPSSVVTPSNNALVTVSAPKRLPSVVVYTLISGYNGIQGCKRIDTVSVRVIDCRPVTQSSITFVMDVDKKDTLCSRDCITYLATTDTLAGGPQTYSWTFRGGLPSSSTDKAPTVCYDLPGQWDVVLQVSNPYPVYETPPGSSAVVSFYKYITVVDYPNVTIVPPGQQRSDTTIKFSQSIVLTATNALTYTWSPRYSISGITGSVVTVNPTKTTQYIVTGKNSARCFSRDTINVIVIEDCGDMFVPNAFSPNGDDVNDVLKVRGVCLETLTFMIFNRWGEKVFETNDVNVGWDGTYHGEKLNTGVFVYRLEGKTYEGKGFSSKGNITLIR